MKISERNTEKLNLKLKKKKKKGGKKWSPPLPWICDPFVPSIYGKGGNGQRWKCTHPTTLLLVRNKPSTTPPIQRFPRVQEGNYQSNVAQNSTCPKGSCIKRKEVVALLPTFSTSVHVGARAMWGPQLGARVIDLRGPQAGPEIAGIFVRSILIFVPNGVCFCALNKRQKDFSGWVFFFFLGGLN